MLNVTMCSISIDTIEFSVAHVILTCFTIEHKQMGYNYYIEAHTEYYYYTYLTK